MQIAVRHESNAKRCLSHEIRQGQEELALDEFASKIMRIVIKNTYAGVQSLQVRLEPNRVTLTGFCENYYTKQLAQQAILSVVGNREIVNDIAVI
jgi:osmotically-inducible protein OsmY